MQKRLAGYTHSTHRRKDMRVPLPVVALLMEGRVYRTVDWSLGGFLITGYKGPLKAGSAVAVRGIGLKASELVPVHIRARVVRLDRGGRLAGQFLGLSEAAFEALQGLMLRHNPMGGVAACPLP